MTEGPGEGGGHLARWPELEGVVERNGLVAGGPLEHDADADVGDAAFDGGVADARLDDRHLVDLALHVDEEAHDDASRRRMRPPPPSDVAVTDLAEVIVKGALDVGGVQRALLAADGHLRR